MSPSVPALLFGSILVLSSACAVTRASQGAAAGQGAAADQKVAASAPAKPALADDLKKAKHCSMERVVGSNIPVEVCESEEDEESNRDAARELLNNAGRMGSQSRGPGN